MWTPKILLLLEFPDWNSIFFNIGIFGCCALPLPLVVGLFLLGVFVVFILRLFVGLFITLLDRVGSLFVTLLQHLDFCCHGQNLFLFIRWCSPGIVLIQQSCFLLVFSHCHEFFSIVGCCAVIDLTLLVLDVCDEVFIWSSLVSLPQVVC